MSANREWTDEEIGVIDSTMDRPAKEVAERLGRKCDNVYSMRSRIRAGWTRKKEALWTAEEDDILRTKAGRVAIPDIASELGRTARATYRRMGIIGVKAGNGNQRSPFMISNRPLVAKSCTTCGFLLPAEWFNFIETRGMKGWHSSCRKCLSRKASAHQSRVKKPSDFSLVRAYVAKADALTVPLAVNTRKEYTEADHAILSDPELTNLEKALRLGRTYTAVASYVRKSGYKSHRHALGNPEHDKWWIDNPNADRVDEITAALKQGLESAGITLPEWDWDDLDMEMTA